MPLSSLIDFISSAESVRGSRLAHPGTDYLEVVVPSATTVRVNLTPGSNFYMAYIFRMLIDRSVVPGAFTATAFVYGTAPLSATVQGSITEMYMDYFLRITHSQSMRLEIVNLTNLNQRWVAATQLLQVSTEDDFIQLERKIAAFQGQSQNRTLESVERILSNIAALQAIQPIRITQLP